MRALVERWGTAYDWRRVESALNAHGQALTEVDGLDLHLLQVRSPRPDARPLVITHGWPSSVLEPLAVMDALADPGSPDLPAFHVVAPSLPGFGFGARPAATGLGRRPDGRRLGRGDGPARARALLRRRRRLGRARHGGPRAPAPRPRRRAAQLHAVRRRAGGARRPRRDRAGLGGRHATSSGGWAAATPSSSRPGRRPSATCSPTRRWPSWPGCWTSSGPGPTTTGTSSPSSRRDQVLDTVTLYWLSGTGGSSARFYWEDFPPDNTGEVARAVGGRRSSPPTSRRSRAPGSSAGSPTCARSRVADRGGHFPMLEVPDRLRRRAAARLRGDAVVSAPDPGPRAVRRRAPGAGPGGDAHRARAAARARERAAGRGGVPDHRLHRRDEQRRGLGPDVRGRRRARPRRARAAAGPARAARRRDDGADHPGRHRAPGGPVRPSAGDRRRPVRAWRCGPPACATSGAAWCSSGRSRCCSPSSGSSCSRSPSRCCRRRALRWCRGRSYGERDPAGAAEDVHGAAQASPSRGQAAARGASRRRGVAHAHVPAARRPPRHPRRRPHGDAARGAAAAHGRRPAAPGAAAVLLRHRAVRPLGAAARRGGRRPGRGPDGPGAQPAERRPAHRPQAPARGRRHRPARLPHAHLLRRAAPDPLLAAGPAAGGAGDLRGQGADVQPDPAAGPPRLRDPRRRRVGGRRCRPQRGHGEGHRQRARPDLPPDRQAADLDHRVLRGARPGRRGRPARPGARGRPPRGRRGRARRGVPGGAPAAGPAPGRPGPGAAALRRGVRAAADHGPAAGGRGGARGDPATAPGGRPARGLRRAAAVRPDRGPGRGRGAAVRRARRHGAHAAAAAGRGRLGQDPRRPARHARGRRRRRAGGAAGPHRGARHAAPAHHRADAGRPGRGGHARLRRARHGGRPADRLARAPPAAARRSPGSRRARRGSSSARTRCSARTWPSPTWGWSSWTSSTASGSSSGPPWGRRPCVPTARPGDDGDAHPALGGHDRVRRPGDLHAARAAGRAGRRQHGGRGRPAPAHLGRPGLGPGARGGGRGPAGVRGLRAHLLDGQGQAGDEHRRRGGLRPRRRTAGGRGRGPLRRAVDRGAVRAARSRCCTASCRPRRRTR